MIVGALLTALALLLQPLLVSTSAGEQATCRAIWIMKVPCSVPARALVEQVKAWSTDEACQGIKEECMYEVVKESPTSLVIQHTSPFTYKTTLMTFQLNPPAAPRICKIWAVSFVFRNATTPNDYCLLYNLIRGSGLTKAPGYKEICTDSMCPPKNAAQCITEG